MITRRSDLDRIAAVLMRKETLERDELEQLLAESKPAPSDGQPSLSTPQR